MTDMTDVMKKWQQEQEKRSQEAQTILVEICQFLDNHGIGEIEITYEGSGDSGQIETITLKTISGEDASPHYVDAVFSHTVKTKDHKVGDAIENICYALLEEKQGGWEINEGSYGTFVINVKGRTVHLHHNQRIEQIEESDENWVL